MKTIRHVVRVTRRGKFRTLLEASERANALLAKHGGEALIVLTPGLHVTPPAAIAPGVKIRVSR